jgi:DNA-directed RNA polymerase subunit RPC12/RpoP
MCKEIREKFQELYSLNVNEYVEKKQGLSYLTWSYAWAEFKKIYPDATYEVKKDESGRCYFGDEQIGYMVYTSVTAGGLTYEMWLPVMDNNNKAMKLNAYTYSTRGGEKSVEAVSMFDINKAVMRCLVKNLAMFGLGLYIYAGEDLPEDIKEYVCTECGAVTDSNMAQRTQNAFGTILCRECGIKRSEVKANESNG